MTLLGLGRETLVDAAVTAVPFAGLLLLAGLLVGYDPWPGGARSLVLSVGVMVVPLVLLALATWVVAGLFEADDAGDRPRPEPSAELAVAPTAPAAPRR